MSVPSPKKILILRWGSMGDLAVCSAVMEDIVRHYPDAEVHLNIEPPWHKLFEADPRFKQLQVMKVRKAPRLRSTREWLAMLKRENYDLLIDLQCNDRSRLLLSLARLFRCAPRQSIATKSGFPYTLSAPAYPSGAHALQVIRAAAQGLGIQCSTEQPVIHSAEDLRQKGLATLAANSLSAGSFAILVPGSSLSGAQKRWGIDNYTKMAALFHEQGIERTVILGGPDEIELCTQLADAIGGSCLNLCGKTELLEIPVIAAQAAYMVSNDTGTAHLAAAANIPLAVICGPTLADKVKPIGRRVAALQVEPECFAVQPAEVCMAKCTPEQVWQALQKLG